MKRIQLFVILVISLSCFFQLTSIAKNNVRKNIDLDLVFIGNSITYGANLENPKQDAPPVIASEYLRNKSGINSVQFSNQGRGGFTTVNYLPKSETLNEVIRATRDLHAESSHRLIFSIMLGTNDSAISGPKGAPVSKEDYRKNMAAIIDELLQNFPDATIVIQQPTWYSTNTYNNSKYLAEGLARLQSYFPELKSLVKSYSTAHKKQVYMGDQQAYEYFRENYLKDLTPENGKQGTFYLHPNKQGAAKLARFWGDAIYKVVE